MAKFNIEETVARAAIEQLVNDWAYDLDFHGNAHVGSLVTEDVVYNVAGAARLGRAAVEAFYAERHQFLKNSGKPYPVMRHINTNFRTSFVSPDEAETFFELIFWTTEVEGFNPADIIAVADVWMTMRRGSDGDWKIAKFDSTQPLKRVG